MKKVLPLIIAGAALFILGFILGLTRNCGGLDPAYYVERVKYDQDVAAAGKLHEADLAEKKRLEADNAEKEKDIQAKAGEIQKLKGQTTAVQGEITGLEAENKRLKQDVQAVIDTNPGVKALVVNFELQITKHRDKEDYLEQRLAKIGEPIDTGRKDEFGQTVYEFVAGTITWDLGQQIQNQKKISKDMQAYGDREHALRLTSDSLRIKAEKKAQRNGTIATVESIVALGVGGFFGIKAGGHALKFW